jgi:receptor protein-tyrosine kinase
MTGFGLAAALLVSAIEPRIYQAHASIQIQGVNENFLNLREIYATAAPSADNAVYVQTQAELLRQDALIEQVVRKMHLEGRRELAGSGLWNGFGSQPDTSEIVDRIKKDLQVVASRGSSLIQIVFNARNPHFAADFANALAQAFIDQTIQARQRSAKQTQEALSKELEQLRAGLDVSQARIDAYDRSRQTRGIDPSSYSKLRREADANRKFSEVLSRRIDEARLASAVSQSNIRLVGPAQPPSRPYRPNIPLNLALGLFGGLILGVGYVVLREQTDTVLRTPGEASALLGVPELGVIPRVGHRMMVARGAADSSLRMAPERASLEQPDSGVAESFRTTLASMLTLGNGDDHPRVLLVTSPCPAEGKTTVVSNLGIALAQIGRKVLLIDADLRQPSMHKVFGQANSWGLSDLLREKNAVEDLPLEALVKKTSVPNLSLLPAGTSADNVFGLLWSSRMAGLLPRFAQEFEYVLVDSPSCLEFADARILGRYAEGLLLVVRAGNTQIASAQAAAQRLDLDGICLTGVVLNGWTGSSEQEITFSHCRRGVA